MCLLCEAKYNDGGSQLRVRGETCRTRWGFGNNNIQDEKGDWGSNSGAAWLVIHFYGDSYHTRLSVFFLAEKKNQIVKHWSSQTLMSLLPWPYVCGNEITYCLTSKAFIYMLVSSIRIRYQFCNVPMAVCWGMLKGFDGLAYHRLLQSVIELGTRIKWCLHREIIIHILSTSARRGWVIWVCTEHIDVILKLQYAAIRVNSHGQVVTVLYSHHIERITVECVL